MIKSIYDEPNYFDSRINERILSCLQDMRLFLASIKKALNNSPAHEQAKLACADMEVRLVNFEQDYIKGLYRSNAGEQVLELGRALSELDDDVRSKTSKLELLKRGLLAK